jgi:hypothetical protein
MAASPAHNLEVDRIIPANRKVDARPSRHAAVERSMLKMSGFPELGWPGNKPSAHDQFHPSGAASRAASSNPGERGVSDRATPAG